MKGLASLFILLGSSASHVILDITRAAPFGIIESLISDFLEFSEDLLRVLVKHARESIESTSVGHAYN